MKGLAGRPMTDLLMMARLARLLYSGARIRRACCCLEVSVAVKQTRK